MRPDEPTDEMPGGAEGPTEVNSPGEEPTGRIPEGNENPTDVLHESDAGPTEVMGGAGHQGPTEEVTTGDSGRKKGIAVLVVSIVASLLLGGAYLAAGGPVGPDKAADPCDPRPWTDPKDLEEAAQQFALSAADGAACELGVSREELTRSVPDEKTRQDFMDEHGFTDADLENALRAGLNRAVDDAENAGAISGLAVVGLRAAIKVMPMSVMIDLLSNADSIFNGDLGSLGGIGDAIEAITGGAGGLGELGSGSSEDPLGGIGDAIEQALPQGTTDSLQELVPKETRKKLEDEAKKRLEQGLDGLFSP